MTKTPAPITGLAFHGPDEYLSYNGDPRASLRMEKRAKAARDVVMLRELSRVATEVGATSTAHHLSELARIYTSPTDTGVMHGPVNMVAVPLPEVDHYVWGDPSKIGGPDKLGAVPTINPTPEVAAMYAQWHEQDMARRAERNA